MAGAAVIAAVTNALDGREFPFVFGGDGASFAVAPADLGRAREALAATATWVREDLDLAMRVALVPVKAVRAQGLDIRVARFGPSPNLSLCDVFRRRSRLGGRGDEARRIRGRRGAARRAAGFVRPVVPVRGNSLRARSHSFGAGGAGQGRRSARIPQSDRRHHRSRRTQPRCGAAGARRRTRYPLSRRRASNTRRVPRAAGRCCGGAVPCWPTRCGPMS